LGGYLNQNILLNKRGGYFLKTDYYTFSESKIRGKMGLQIPSMFYWVY
jgi:cytochrome c oxidase assembly protein Cox11